MTFQRIRNFPLSEFDLTCKQSGRPLWFVGFFLLAAGAGLWFAPVPLIMKILFSVFDGLIAMVFLYQARKTMHPQNWLLRVGGRGVSVKFRSYRNHHFPDTDEVIVSFEFREIEFVRRFEQRIRQPGQKGESSVWESVLYLDLGLRDVNLNELSRRLHEELNRDAPEGVVKSKALHFPVQLVDGNVLRLEWRGRQSLITPAIDKTIERLSKFARVEKDQEQSINLTKVPESDAQKDHQILELATRGETIAAIRLARRFHNMDLKTAKDHVEKLMNQPPVQ